MSDLRLICGWQYCLINDPLSCYKFIKQQLYKSLPLPDIVQKATREGLFYNKCPAGVLIQP